MSAPAVFLIGVACGIAGWAGWVSAASRFVLWREHRGWETDPRPVTVTLTVDTTGFNETMRGVSAAMSKMGPLVAAGVTRSMQDWTHSMEKLRDSMKASKTSLAPLFARVAADREVKVAGLCARYYVRAGLDPKYRDPDMLHLLVLGILGGSTNVRLTPDEKRQVAVAAMRGWSEQYQKGAHLPMAEVRHYGSAVVTVIAA